MKLHHIALWTHQPDALRDFYTRWFQGIAGARYENPAKKFESYFVRFGDGTALEIMRGAHVPANLNDRIHAQYTGLIHMAFELPDGEAVDRMAIDMQQSGCPILDGPRRTGDGYYEFVTTAPDGNRVEVTTLAV